jgi:glutaminyl-tRNA synthetase
VEASANAGFKADAYLDHELVSDEGSLGPVIDSVLAAHADQVAAYRAGKEGLLGFFVGQVMKETAGAANPKLVGEMLRQKLAG